MPAFCFLHWGIEQFIIIRGFFYNIWIIIIFIFALKTKDFIKINVSYDLTGML